MTRPSRPTAAIATSRNRTFLPIESTSSDRSLPRATASGRPGNPPPLPRSSRSCTPRARRGAAAARLSRTCASATSAGSRIAVRLIAPVHASSSRTCPSMTAREDASSTSPRSRRPASRTSVVRRRERREVRNARRERTSRPVQWAPLLRSSAGPPGSRSRRRSFAAALRQIGLTPSGRFRPGFPRDPSRGTFPSAHTPRGVRTLGWRPASVKALIHETTARRPACG